MWVLPKFTYLCTLTILYSSNAWLSVSGLEFLHGLPFMIYVAYTSRRVFSAYMTTHIGIISSSKLKQRAWTALFLQETTALMFVTRFWTMHIIDTRISGSSGIWLVLENDLADRYPDSIWRYGIAYRCNSCVHLRMRLREIRSFAGFLRKMSGKDMHMPTVIYSPHHLWTQSDIYRLIALFIWYGSGPGSCYCHGERLCPGTCFSADQEKKFWIRQ